MLSVEDQNKIEQRLIKEAKGNLASIAARFDRLPPCLPDDAKPQSDAEANSARQPVTYFVCCDGFVKIGITTSMVECRIRGGSTMNPHPIEVIGHIPGNCERELHSKFADWRHRGEWFLFPPEMHNTIRSEILNRGGTISPTTTSKS